MQGKIQQIFRYAWDSYAEQYHPDSFRTRAAHAIMDCKSGALGCNYLQCEDCGFIEIAPRSCRNRNCPSCQATLKELWIDQRKAEVIDAPYFHVVFTVPAELNPIIYENQKLLYTLLHKSVSQTLLVLSGDPKHLGATPGIIQVLHTWGQTLNYHPHIHCIVSGGGLTPQKKLKTCRNKFFIPVHVMRNFFQKTFLKALQEYYQQGKLSLHGQNSKYLAPKQWDDFRKALYDKDWCPYIKETFNGFGNAIDYLGRYTHRIAISNSRILSVAENEVTFSYTDYRDNQKKTMTITCLEFIRRFMQHVLPKGFQKIRYYGYLNNRYRTENMKLIFRLQGHQSFHARYIGLKGAELVTAIWGDSVHTCPRCHKQRLAFVMSSAELHFLCMT